MQIRTGNAILGQTFFFIYRMRQYRPHLGESDDIYFQTCSRANLVAWEFFAGRFTSPQLDSDPLRKSLFPGNFSFGHFKGSGLPLANS